MPQLFLRDIEQALRESGLNDADKEYIKAVLKPYEAGFFSNGIDESEYVKIYKELQNNTRDSLDPYELQKFHAAMMKRFGKPV